MACLASLAVQFSVCSLEHTCHWLGVLSPQPLEQKKEGKNSRRAYKEKSGAVGQGLGRASLKQALRGRAEKSGHRRQHLRPH